MIAFNSAAGFAAHFHDGPNDWKLAGVFSTLAVADPSPATASPRGCR